MLKNSSRLVVGFKVNWHLRVYTEIKETLFLLDYVVLSVFALAFYPKCYLTGGKGGVHSGARHKWANIPSPWHTSDGINLWLLSVIHHPGYLRQSDSWNICSCHGKWIMLHSTIQRNSRQCGLYSAMRYLPNLTTDIYIYKWSINKSKSRGSASETNTRLWTEARWKKQPQRGLLIQLWTSAITLPLGFTETESGRQMELVSFQSGGTE